MKKNELTALEIIATGAKCAYLKPSCKVLSLETESMICGSVTGVTDNKNVSEDQNDPWYTGQTD